MKKQKIIEILKETYDKDLRKQVVKTILANEEESNDPNYQIINQIFSYVLKELNWNMTDNTKNWDNTPLDIMEKAFPKLETTRWFDEQILTAKKAIELQMKNSPS